MIDLIVFDMAGTTVNDGDAVSTCFRAALAGAGVVIPHAATNAVMGLPKPEAIRLLLTQYGADAGENTIAAVHTDFVARMKRYYQTDPAVREVTGAAATFAALRSAGVKVALNTGFSRAITDVILDRLQWRGPDFPLDATISSDEVAHGRPHPDMIRALMALFALTDPRRVAKVGDTKADLEEGFAAGCGWNIGVTTGSYTREQLEQFPHTHILASVCDVPHLVLPAGENGAA